MKTYRLFLSPKDVYDTQPYYVEAENIGEVLDSARKSIPGVENWIDRVKAILECPYDRFPYNS